MHAPSLPLPLTSARCLVIGSFRVLKSVTGLIDETEWRHILGFDVSLFCFFLFSC